MNVFKDVRILMDGGTLRWTVTAQILFILAVILYPGFHEKTNAFIPF